ncbi:MAG: hypothetical protein LBQ82_04555 [Treponema sp.]|jgi:hypothetical protein|nr:hypothetical protein [Treponema sp.]
MKNMVKLVGVIALVAVIGFSFVACDDDGSDLDGTWVANDNGVQRKIVADGGKFTQYQNNDKCLEGTYPADAKSPVTVTITRVNTIMFNEADQWYNWAELPPTYQGYVGSQTYNITVANGKFTVNGLTFQRQ